MRRTLLVAVWCAVFLLLASPASAVTNQIQCLSGTDKNHTVPWESRVSAEQSFTAARNQRHRARPTPATAGLSSAKTIATGLYTGEATSTSACRHYCKVAKF